MFCSIESKVSISPPPAIAAPPVLQRENTSARRTGIGRLLLFHKGGQPFFFNKAAVLYQAGTVSGDVALLQIFNGFAGVFEAFIAIRKIFFDGAFPYGAVAAMLRLLQASAVAAPARLRMIAMLVTYLTIHPTGSKHHRVDGTGWHFHQNTLYFIIDCYRD